jgi:hypothetical protein
LRQQRNFSFSPQHVETLAYRFERKSKIFALPEL